MMTPFRIVIADDHDLSRSGLRAVLEGAANLKVVGEAADGAEAVRQCQSLGPDLVLLDIRMTGMDGLQAAAEIRHLCPATRIIMLTMHDSVDYLEAAIKAGASGYALKDVRRDDLLKMIGNVLEGQAFFDPQLMRRLLSRVGRAPPTEELIEKLTLREKEILCRLTTGETNKAIARTLAIAPGTVKVHVERILTKLSVTDRTQAAVIAVQAGLVAPETLR